MIGSIKTHSYHYRFGCSFLPRNSPTLKHVWFTLYYSWKNAPSVQLRHLIYKTTNVLYLLTLKYSYHSFWFYLHWIYMVVASAAETHILDLVFLCCDDVEKRWSNHRQSSDWEENKWVFFSFLTSTKDRQHFASLFVLNWLTWQMVTRSK